MHERTRILILGWYGSNNTGDEALVQVIVQQLRERGFSDLVALSTQPAKTGGRLGVRSVSRNLLNLSTLRALRGAKALILGGGGLIQDGTSVYNLPIYAMYAVLARLMGLKVIGWGLGAEPLWTRLGRLLARMICASAHYFSVRDSASKALLVRAGVAPQRIKVTADPAILLQSDDPATIGLPGGEQPKVIFCLRHLPANRPGFGLHYLMPVSLRHRFGIEWRHDPGRVERLLEGTARSIKVAVEEFGAKVILLPLWPGRDDEMLDVVAKCALHLGVPLDSVVRAELENTPSRFSAYVGRADLLVSMRLHALIFGAAHGLPMLALSYARKVRGFMSELGIDRWVVEVERKSPDPDEMVAALRALWANRAEEGAQVARSAEWARKIASADADMIGHVLSTGAPS